MAFTLRKCGGRKVTSPKGHAMNTHRQPDFFPQAVVSQPMPADPDAGRCAILALVRAETVDAAALRHLRGLGLGDGGLSREEADALFAVERGTNLKIPEWDRYFIDAITTHCVWDLRPTGVVNESQGEWLIEAADRARTANALAVLVEVLAAAHRVPMWLTAAVRARQARGWPGGAGKLV